MFIKHVLYNNNIYYYEITSYVWDILQKGNSVVGTDIKMAKKNLILKKNKTTTKNMCRTIEIS